jgi:hypothetical protein
MAERADTLAALIERERERLTRQREAVLAKRQEAEDEIAAIDKELLAVTAYFDIKEGRTAPLAQEPRKGWKPRAASPAPGAPRRGRRGGILKLLTDNPGLTTGEIIDRLGARNDKSAWQSVNNAIADMKRKKKIRTEGEARRRRHFVASQPTSGETSGDQIPLTTGPTSEAELAMSSFGSQSPMSTGSRKP